MVFSFLSQQKQGVYFHNRPKPPIPLAERSKTRVYGRPLAGIVGSNPAGGKDVSLAGVVFCQVEVSAMGRFLIQRNPTDCGVSMGDLKT